jgi:hypothetical protein
MEREGSWVVVSFWSLFLFDLSRDLMLGIPPNMVSHTLLTVILHKYIYIAGPTITIDGKPVAGQMKFDMADIASLERLGNWLDVIKHEMGHILGIGTRVRKN